MGWGGASLLRALYMGWGGASLLRAAALPLPRSARRVSPLAPPLLTPRACDLVTATYLLRITRAPRAACTHPRSLIDLPQRQGPPQCGLICTGWADMSDRGTGEGLD